MNDSKKSVQSPKPDGSLLSTRRYLGLSVAAWTVIGSIATVASLIAVLVSFVVPGRTPSAGAAPPTANRNATGSGEPPTGAWVSVPVTDWRAFGQVVVTSASGGIMQVAFTKPLTLANKWAGVISRLSASCDYTIEMQARVLSHQNGGGYGLASGELDAGSLPRGPAFQYDFGFHGYRVLTYPNDFAQPAGSSEQAILNDGWHILRMVVSDGITAYVDGAYALRTTSPAACGKLMIRVWSATIQLRNIRIRQGKA